LDIIDRKIVDWHSYSRYIEVDTTRLPIIMLRAGCITMTPTSIFVYLNEPGENPVRLVQSALDISSHNTTSYNQQQGMQFIRLLVKVSLVRCANASIQSMYSQNAVF